DKYKESGDSNNDGVANDFINCEHTWPQSFFNKSMPMVGDLHHLQSTMSVPNNRRSHFPFGEIAQGSVIYSTSGGSKLGVTQKPGKAKLTLADAKKIFALPKEQSDKILDEQSYPTFEPMDAQKGNTARCLLYFYLRYYDQNVRQGTFDKNNFWVSKVPTFIKWNEQLDPVNDIDRKRNDLVFKKQGNRNPFIDIPNLTSIISENVLESK
ncbi:MAG: endonuclease, partial [Candidatus Sericytochromatia bacterium]|nr:endonuclease [Candidatus Sericytochromatia bacterium]